MAKETAVCTKCRTQLPEPRMTPAYCDKCALVTALLVERYSPTPRQEKATPPPPPETFRG